MKSHTINVSDDVYDYLRGMIDDAAAEDEPIRLTFSGAVGRLIEDREAGQ